VLAATIQGASRLQRQSDLRARSSNESDQRQRAATRSFIHPRAARQGHEGLTSLLTGALRPEQDYRLPVPALLVHGQLDQLGDIALSTRAWAQREPLAEYVVISAAGHASNLDNPAAFTAALLAFLDRVLGPGEEEPPSPTEHGEELRR
jgi:pimeloyl-ACP methyl ester carboxylesterase